MIAYKVEIVLHTVSSFLCRVVGSFHEVPNTNLNMFSPLTSQDVRALAERHLTSPVASGRVLMAGRVIRVDLFKTLSLRGYERAISGLSETYLKGGLCF